MSVSQKLASHPITDTGKDACFSLLMVPSETPKSLQKIYIMQSSQKLDKQKILESLQNQRRKRGGDPLNWTSLKTKECNANPGVRAAGVKANNAILPSALAALLPPGSKKKQRSR